MVYGWGPAGVPHHQQLCHTCDGNTALSRWSLPVQRSLPVPKGKNGFKQDWNQPQRQLSEAQRCCELNANISFLLFLLHITLTQSYTCWLPRCQLLIRNEKNHSRTDGTASGNISGSQYLAQAHSDMQTGPLIFWLVEDPLCLLSHSCQKSH